MADSRSNGHHQRQTSMTAQYINPFINFSSSSDDDIDMHDHGHTSLFPENPAPAANYHASVSTTTFPPPPPPPQQPFHTGPPIPIAPPSYPTLALANPFTASPDVLLGFHPPAQVVADNIVAASATRTVRPPRSAMYSAIHTPLAPGESLFDPGMDRARREAILGGWVDAEGRETPEMDEHVVRRYVEEDQDGGEEGGKERDGRKKTKRGKRGGKRRNKNAQGGKEWQGGGHDGRGGFGGGFGGGMVGAGPAVY